MKYVGIKKLAKLSGYTYATLKWYSEIEILPYEQDGQESTRIYDVDVCLGLLKTVSRLKKLGLSLAQIQQKLPKTTKGRGKTASRYV